jgi:hypothetical protein
MFIDVTKFHTETYQLQSLSSGITLIGDFLTGVLTPTLSPSNVD